MRRISWYYKRLMSMSPAEVIYRFKKGIENKIRHLSLNKETFFQVPMCDIVASWYFEKDMQRDIVKCYKIAGFHDISYDNFLKHTFTFFSIENKYLGKDIDWHFDYKNGKKAPLSYSGDINCHDFDVVGNIKYIWELNRHQHLITLSKQYYLTGDDSYKNEVLTELDQWIAINPYLKGVNWCSSLEVALRVISWSWVWNFISDIEPALKEKWLKSIFLHCRFIEENLSRYSSANNHLIGEAAGLFIGSLVWNFGKVSDKQREKAFSILIREIAAQNYDDGVNKEQAISYQQFVIDFFLLAGLLGKKNGIQFPDKYWTKIENMLEYVNSSIDCKGGMPNIGDSDDGRAIILSGRKDFNIYKSLLATGAVIFGRGDFKTMAGEFDEKSFWLLGAGSYEAYRNMPEKEIVIKKEFRKGGYFLLSDYDGEKNEIKLMFDCGPVGYLSLAAHGHADCLSFTLTVEGKKFFIDPGTYVYAADKEWRNYFKGTLAHNTVTIDKADQSVSGGNFMWLKKAGYRLMEYKSDALIDMVRGEQYGYMRLVDPVAHQREVIFDKRKRHIKIRDIIKSKKRHLIELNFHLDKECAVTKKSLNRLELANNGRAIVMEIDDKLNCHLFNGSLDPKAGWQSDHFDVKNETITLNAGNEFVGECEFETTITL